MDTWAFITAPQYVGQWEIGNGGLLVPLERKPLWLHRVMARLLLGWEWVDA